MSDATPSGPGSASGIPGAEDVPDVEVEKRRGISIIWVVPIIAAAIGAWLWYQAEQEKGPAVTIRLATADDIEKGKTRVKFKNVDLGEVENIEFTPDYAGVTITVQMNRRATPYLREGTRFWVVRPRIGARGITGLGTLVSGAYIEMEPGPEGPARLDFTGLEDPPVAPADAPGLRLRLLAQDLESIDIGSGVYFKGVQVGQVEHYDLDVERHAVTVGLYIEPGYAPLVHHTSRFFNTSGIEGSLSADGVQVSMQSLDALVRGGIAFESPVIGDAGDRAGDGDEFELFTNRARALEQEITSVQTLVMFFTGSVRGLVVGAPMEFRGIKVGTVKDFWLEYDADTQLTRIPVVCNLQRGLARRTGTGAPEKPADEIRGLIARGLRARLSTGSLLTGALFVDLDLLPETEPVLRGGTDLIELPTVPSTSETVSHSLTQVSEIVTELRGLIRVVDDAAPVIVSNVEQASQTLVGTLSEATRTLQGLQTLTEESSQLRGPLQDLLTELGASLRSVRQLTDMLERHPEALLQGKP
jgi:paraquat-inducible protein B